MTGLMRVPTQTIRNTVAELNATRLSWSSCRAPQVHFPMRAMFALKWRHLFVLIHLEYVFSETLQAVLSTGSSHK